jgi:hypothetical protein
VKQNPVRFLFGGTQLEPFSCQMCLWFSVYVCLTSEVDSVNEKQNRVRQEGTTEASNTQGCKAATSSTKFILLKYTCSVIHCHITDSMESLSELSCKTCTARGVTYSNMMKLRIRSKRLTDAFTKMLMPGKSRREISACACNRNRVL